jgi:predicted nucleic acid-binding protein
MVLVDTSVWIECARREGEIACKIGLEGLVEAAEALICEVIKFEVLAGARAQDRPRLSAGLGCLPIRTVGEAAWEFALMCAWRLRDKGHVVPWNDILIGSLSLQWGCRVYAVDRHFEIMREVIGIRLYQPGYGGSFASELESAPAPSA